MLRALPGRSRLQELAVLLHVVIQTARERRGTTPIAPIKPLSVPVRMRSAHSTSVLGCCCTWLTYKLYR